MPHSNAPVLDSSPQSEESLRIWSIINRLDQILTELDALNLCLPASHISLGTELLWKIRSSPSKG